MDENKELSALSKEALIEMIRNLQAKTFELNGLIKILAFSNIQYEEKYKKENPDLKAFDQEWEWTKKLLFIVRRINRPARSNEILEHLVKCDLRAEHWRDKTKSLSVYLNKATRYQMILPYKKYGVRGYYYVLPEWLSIEGELLPEYKIIE